MRIQLFIVALVASLSLVTGCSKSSGSSGQGVLGQAVNPGEFPDGTQATPVTQAQAQQVVQSFSGTISVLGALSQASPQSTMGSLGLNPKLSTSPTLAQLIQQNCEITNTQTQPSTQNLQRNGQNVSGSATLSGSGSIVGPNCPLTATSSVQGTLKVAGTLDSSGQQLQNYVANGQATFREDLSATNQLPSQYDFKSMSINLSLSGSITATQSSQSISANIQGTAVVNTTQFTNLNAQLLSEINVSTQGGQATSGDVKAALIIKTPAQTLLIQIFAQASNPNGAQVYVNGQLVNNSWLNRQLHLK